MTIFQRLRGIIIGLAMILAGFIMMIAGEDIYVVIIAILGLVLFFTGLRYLIYYFRLGRFMVGGRMILFIGVILLDFGLFTMTLNDEPLVIIVIYLIAFYAFAGLVDILRAMEAKKFQAGSWKMKFITGVIEIAVAAIALYCGLIIRSPRYVVLVYSLGVICSGFMRIVESFRRTSIVYIQ